jgi:hypothetical protein
MIVKGMLTTQYIQNWRLRTLPSEGAVKLKNGVANSDCSSLYQRGSLNRYFAALTAINVAGKKTIATTASALLAALSRLLSRAI